MYGLELIAILAITGGVIAYIGDKLGTRIGKKRLSIFGLRPKHTSILITIITGILIVTATLGTLTLASQDVRTALFGMEALQQELTALNQAAAVKNKELEDSRIQLELKTKEYSSLTAKVRETSLMLADISKELTSVTAERDRAAVALAAAESQYAAASAEIKNLQALKSDLDKRVTSLSQAKNDLQDDVNRLNELTEKLQQGLQVVREGSIIFQTGQVLYTSVVPVGHTLEDRQTIVRSTMYQANQNLLQRLNVEDKTLDVLWISKQEFDKAVSTLSAVPDSAVVRIAASGNTVYGEPVIGHITIFPNRQIYREGEMVYSERMEAPGTSKGAEDVVLAFLQKVNAAAVEQGVLPDPLAGTVGSVSGAQFYDTVDKIKRYNGSQIELTASAMQATSTVGPLKIDIRIRALP